MKIETIFLANLSEVARPLARLMRKTRREVEIWEDHGLCDRFLFSDRDNTLLITPFPINKDFFADSMDILQLKNIHNLTPKRIGESLCEAITKDKALLKTIEETIRDNPGVRIISYVASVEFCKLIKYLNTKNLKFVTPELSDVQTQWTQAYFGSKAGFRQEVTEMDGNFPHMPEGTICNKLSEVKEFAEYLFKKGAAGVVLKTNRGLAGAGLIILRRNEIKLKNLPKILSNLWRTESYWRKDLVVVEEYKPADQNICGGAPNIELKIIDHHAEPSYVCGMRISKEGVFQGVEIGKGAVPPNIEKVLLSASKILGGHILSHGYRGFFEIDWVAGIDGKLYPIESNLRRTGGTHVFETAKHLLGADFLKHYYIGANNMAEGPRLKGMTYPEIKNRLRPLLYPINGNKEGIILTVLNLFKLGKFGYIAIGKDKDRVLQIENKLRALVID